MLKKIILAAASVAAILAAAPAGAADTKEFRITIRPSGMWGFIGVGIIALAVLVLLAAIWRFGRR